jgi:small nuclear ribonucleoprotein (snRNP)-like protein
MKGDKEKKDKKDIIDLLRGKKVVVQSDKGVIYEGILVGYQKMGPGLGNAQIVLSDVTIKGSKHIVETDLVVISMKHVVHYHTEPKSVIEIKEQEPTEKQKTKQKS